MSLIRPQPKRVKLEVLGDSVLRKENAALRQKVFNLEVHCNALKMVILRTQGDFEPKCSSTKYGDIENEPEPAA